MRDLLGVSGGFNRSWEGLEQVGIVSRNHYNALSVQYLGIRQTMWQHGGHCSGVSVKILSQQNPLLSVSGVEKLYLCTGFTRSALDF